VKRRQIHELPLRVVEEGRQFWIGQLEFDARRTSGQMRVLIEIPSRKGEEARAD
jgi:hypothetical protein